MDDQSQQIGNRAVVFERMPQHPSWINLIPILAPIFLHLKHAIGGKFANDALNGSLRDSDKIGNLPRRQLGIPPDAHQYMGVVGEVRPTLIDRF